MSTHGVLRLDAIMYLHMEEKPASDAPFAWATFVFPVNPTGI